MTNTKWLRQALLGSVALGVMATGAQADELSELKAQLEGLQSRVNQLEQQPTYAALPEGASFLTLNRGSVEFPNYGTQAAQDKHQMPSNRGFTIAVTPTADLPAPIAEVVVYGYVKGDVIYDFDGIDADTFTLGALHSRDDKGSHVRLHARQTRFGIRSRTDTAIGQIRTQIEGHFFGAGGAWTLRHAYGEWDMTPNWTLLVGQTWFTAGLLPIGVPLVDFGASAGVTFSRTPQVRMTYHSGPISWAVAIEQPTFTSSAKWPNLASYLQFDAPGGHQFIVTGVVADQRGTNYDNWAGNDVGWAVQAGANVNLADIATLTVGGLYGQGGPLCTYLAQDFACGVNGFSSNKVWDDFLNDDGWGIMAGLSFGLTDTTTFNVQYGISRMQNEWSGWWAPDHVTTQTVHANILWRPVQQMQLGWEVMWGQYDFDGGQFFSGDNDCGPLANRRCPGSKDDAIRAQFGAWFFF
jgi:hypothetical protein